MKGAKDWVTVGWVSKRISTLPIHTIRRDMIDMVNGNTLERIGNGGSGHRYRYAITGKFVPNQFIKQRSSQRKRRRRQR